MDSSKTPKKKTKATCHYQLEFDKLLATIKLELEKLDALEKELAKLESKNNNQQEQVNSKSKKFSLNLKPTLHKGQQTQPRRKNKANTSPYDKLLAAIELELEKLDALEKELANLKSINNNQQEQVNSKSEKFSLNLKQTLHKGQQTQPKRKNKATSPYELEYDKLLATIELELEKLDAFEKKFANLNPINNNQQEQAKSENFLLNLKQTLHKGPQTQPKRKNKVTSPYELEFDKLLTTIKLELEKLDALEKEFTGQTV